MVRRFGRWRWILMVMGMMVAARIDFALTVPYPLVVVLVYAVMI